MIEIPLTQGKVALIDDEDAWILRIFKKWQAVSAGPGRYYAKRGGHRLHRLVMRLDMDGFNSPGMVDHINGNGLDNRRCNLRMCTPAQNIMNRGPLTQSGLRGVVYLRPGYYRARIRIDGKRHDLGRFMTAEDAAAAYEVVAKMVHGEFYRAR